MAHDVFVSYANKDKPVADAVVAGLEQEGIRCWCAPRDIAPGSSWGEAINTAIEGSRFMVIVLSGNSNRSHHVVREVERAVANDVIIIPFRIENISPTGAMAYFLSTEHWLDALTPPLKKHIEELVGTIQRFQDGGEPPPKTTPAPSRRVNPWTILISAAVLVLLIVLAAIFLPRWLGAGEPETTPAGGTAEAVQENAQGSAPSTTPLPVETPTPTLLPSFTLLGTWPSSREIHDIVLDGNIAYLANGEDGLVILDLSDPSTPVELGRYELGNAQNVQVVGNFAYVADNGTMSDWEVQGDGFVVLNVSDPADPFLVEKIKSEGLQSFRPFTNFAVDNEHLYLVKSGQMVIVDISDLEQAITLGEIDFTSNVASPGICLDDDIVYILANELSIVDASDPANPMEIGGFDAGWGSDVVVVDETAYLAGWDEGLTILNVSDPARPVKLGRFFELVGDYTKIPTGAASRQTIMDVAVSGDRAFLTYRFGLDHGTWTQALESGAIALDISDPAEPAKLAVYSKLEEVSGVAAAGDLVLVTDSTRGLFILGMPE